MPSESGEASCSGVSVGAERAPRLETEPRGRVREEESACYSLKRA